jgi:lycopene cyclase domain-containing protein
MSLEYLIFNLTVLAGPIALSFEKGVHYVGRWKYAFMAILPVLILFVVWDILVTGRHWWFNDQYITGLKIAGLPIEEWLFFITIPFSVLFVWEIFSRKTGNPISSNLKFIKILFLFFPLPGVILFLLGKEYTGLTLISLGFVGVFDLLLSTDILARKNTYIYLGIIFLFNLVFNGYLTGRPVVLYNETYQLGIRILTIPIEDFIYGFSMLLMNTILYEKFKSWHHEK